MKYINVPIFLISLAIGLFFVYVTMPDTRKIYVYPSPENIDLIQYKDKTETCFKYTQKETKCPANENEIAKIPIQT